MTDNVVVSAGTGTTIAADEVVDATLGTVKVQYVKLMDGTLDGSAKAKILAASTAPVATDPSLVVAISPNSVNANGLAVAGSSAPVVIAPQTLDVVVTPTVTASAYTANNIIGGIMTFANILPTVGTNGVLQSITAKFKATAVTGNITVAIFKANPSNGTYGDKTAGTYNSADMANLIGIYQLTAPLALGAYTMTVYCLDAIGKAFVGSSTSLYAIATVAGTPTPASASDFSLELSVLPG
jgi:hypothetical protein